ncbi:hypothetical protein ACTHAM_002339 [Cellulomonas soli]|uniref:hypothetical protein n=1 Tax=Cellulomonas soli TaxID=931535 RepID=UPI003F876DFB
MTNVTGESTVTGGSYTDFLTPGEVLHRSVEDVCIQAEKQGWRVQKRDQRGFRYWCACPGARQHSVYIDAAEMRYERLDFLLEKTCLKFD